MTTRDPWAEPPMLTGQIVPHMIHQTRGRIAEWRAELADLSGDAYYDKLDAIANAEREIADEDARR